MANPQFCAVSIGVISMVLSACTLPVSSTPAESDSTTSARMEIFEWPRAARDARQYLRQRPNMGESERRAFVRSRGLPSWFGRRPPHQLSAPAPLSQLLSESERAGLASSARALPAEAWNFTGGTLHVCPSHDPAIERLYYPAGDTDGPCVADVRVHGGVLTTISPMDLSVTPTALLRRMEGRWRTSDWIERRGRVYVLLAKDSSL